MLLFCYIKMLLVDDCWRIVVEILIERKNFLVNILKFFFWDYLNGSILFHFILWACIYILYFYFVILLDFERFCIFLCGTVRASLYVCVCLLVVWFILLSQQKENQLWMFISFNNNSSLIFLSLSLPFHCKSVTTYKNNNKKKTNALESGGRTLCTCS